MRLRCVWGAFEPFPTRKLRLFASKNCLIELVFSVVIRSSKKTGRSPLPRLKVEVFGAYGGRKQDGGESFTRLTALASKGSADKYLRLVAKHAPFWVRLWQMRSQEIVAHRPNHRKERSKRVGEQGTRTRSTRTPTLKHMNWLIIVLRTLHNSPCTSGVRTPFEHFPIYLKPHSRVLGSWQLEASNQEAWLWIN